MRPAPLLAAVLAAVLSASIWVPVVAAEPPATPAETPSGDASATALKILSAPIQPPPVLPVAAAIDAGVDKPAVTAIAPAAPRAASPVVRKPAAPKLTVRIDLSAQRLSLAYDGASHETWAISSGRDGFETPRGVFRPKWSSKMWYSRKYDNAPMPHAVFFNGGVAVHGTQSLGMLGRPASHGCIRLAPANAARFYALVHTYGYAATRIEVIGTTPATRMAARPSAGRRVAAPVRQRPVGQRPVGRGAQPSPQQAWGQPLGKPSWSWNAAQPQRPVARSAHRGRAGVVHLPPNSPYRGRSSFVHNGVTYVRVQ